MPYRVDVQPVHGTACCDFYGELPRREACMDIRFGHLGQLTLETCWDVYLKYRIQTRYAKRRIFVEPAAR